MHYYLYCHKVVIIFTNSISLIQMNPDFSEEFEQKPLPWNLFSPDDTEEEILRKKRLAALVSDDNSITPNEAAIQFDAAVTSEADMRLQETMKRPDPRNLTAEEEAQGIPSTRVFAPNPSGAIEDVFPWIARLCSAFPPYHPAQDRIIVFLGALRALPRHDVPDGIPPQDCANEPYPSITLWPLGGTWQGLPEIFRVEELGMFRFQDVLNRLFSDIERSSVSTTPPLAQLPVCHGTSDQLRLDRLQLS